MFAPGTENFDKDAWKNNPDPDFLDICIKSTVRPSWRSYQKVLQSNFGRNIIKPINWYAANIIAPPKLVSINNNIVRLRQYTHADIFLLKEENEELYHVDRPWVRQYYPTNFQATVPDNCFDVIHKFYTPWFPDIDVEISYEQPQEESAFHIYEMKDFRHYIGNTANDYVRPHFIPFSFKKSGPHMEDSEFGVVRMPSPMFDMVFAVNDIIKERIEEFYEKAV
jgi:hypothetical protein